ncbi:hypothetical protein N9R76_01155 [Planktomarina temperata]|nr:hypothetical protein [Planktomarina temperata]
MTEYSYNKDLIIQELDEKGYSFLPTIKPIVELHRIYENYLEESITSTYSTSSKSHQNLIEILKLDHLFGALHFYAQTKIRKKIDPNDQYLVSRHVQPGQVSEGYRGHFDSHFFTIVLPVKIPEIIAPKKSGQLVALPNARKHPRLEMRNIYDKILWKRRNSESNYDKLVSENNALELDFLDYKPLIFLGNSTFHGNRPLTGSQEPRLSMLCHLYDTNPRFGVGALMRSIRNR